MLLNKESVLSKPFIVGLNMFSNVKFETFMSQILIQFDF